MRYHYFKNAFFTLIIFLVLCIYAIEDIASESLPHDKRLGNGRHTITLTVDGLKRNYIVHVPDGYDFQTPSPVVVMLHGGGGTAKATIWKTGWTEKADKAGFIAVFPNAMPKDPFKRASFTRNPQLWNDGSDRFHPDQKAINDVRFINMLFDDICSRFHVDKDRIYVTGFSNGASMTFLVGAQLSDRIAAIAPVSGACWSETVVLKRPVAMLYITGNADPLNLIEGGVPKLVTGNSDIVRAKPKPPVRDSIMKWVRALNCVKTPSSISDENGVRTETYGPCTSGAEVVYITVDALGHTWAGGRRILPKKWVGNSSNKISATDVIWDFFKKHSGSIKD